MVPFLLPGAAWAVIRNFAPFAGVGPPINDFRKIPGIVRESSVSAQPSASTELTSCHSSKTAGNHL